MTSAIKFDLQKFKDDGVCVVRDLLDRQALADINRDMDRLFAIQLQRLGLTVDAGGTDETLNTNAVRLLRADVPTYISTARLTQMLPSANRLMLSAPILELARAAGVEFPVICTRLANHIMSDDLKIPNGYHKSPAHQDWRATQGSLDSVVIWAPTTPHVLARYPLQVVPGSHRFGLLDTVAHIMTPTVNDPRITEDAFVPLSVEPGDVAIFSTFLVHRTGEKGDGKLRVAYSARYNNAVESSFVEHGFPTPYKYSYQTELIVENFPTVDDVARFFPVPAPT